MFGLSNLKGINKALGLIIDIIRKWRKKRAQKRAQKQADRIADNPTAAARSMFNDKDDAE